MNIRILTVGDVKQDYFIHAAEEYLKRLGAYASMEVAAVKPEPLRNNMSRSEERQAVEAEGGRIIERLTPSHFNVALDPGGKMLTSEEFAKRLDDLILTGQTNWTFLIGGPLGLSRQVRKQANLVLSLSKFTFPHELVPVVITEQLYRAFKILRGEPYHR